MFSNLSMWKLKHMRKNSDRQSPPCINFPELDESATAWRWLSSSPQWVKEPFLEEQSVASRRPVLDKKTESEGRNMGFGVKIDLGLCAAVSYVPTTCSMTPGGLLTGSRPSVTYDTYPIVLF